MKYKLSDCRGGATTPLPPLISTLSLGKLLNICTQTVSIIIIIIIIDLPTLFAFLCLNVVIKQQVCGVRTCV